MADLSDVTALVVALAGGAVYPNGSNPATGSVSGRPVEIYEGWPKPDRLSQDVRGKMLDATGKEVDSELGTISHVSVFPMNGSAAQVAQVIEEPVVLVPPVHGCAVSLSGQTVTLTGTPIPPEFVTIVADGRRSYSRPGATVAAILAALLADAKVDYPSATSNGTSTITIPAANLVVRVGSTATLGRLIARQKTQIMVTVWAPTPAERSALAAAIDVVMKQNLRVTFADQSQGILTYERTNQIDDRQVEGIYRRDLIYSVEYGTLEKFVAYEVTSVGVTTDNDGGVPVVSVT